MCPHHLLFGAWLRPDLGVGQAESFLGMDRTGTGRRDLTHPTHSLTPQSVMRGEEVILQKIHKTSVENRKERDGSESPGPVIPKATPLCPHVFSDVPDQEVSETGEGGLRKTFGTHTASCGFRQISDLPPHLPQFLQLCDADSAANLPRWHMSLCEA